MKKETFDELNKLFPLPNPTSEEIEETFARMGRKIEDKEE